MNRGNIVGVDPAPTDVTSGRAGDAVPDTSDDEQTIERAARRAAALLERALAEATRAERRRQRRLGRIVEDAGARELVQRLTDEVLRISRARPTRQPASVVSSTTMACRRRSGPWTGCCSLLAPPWPVARRGW